MAEDRDEIEERRKKECLDYVRERPVLRRLLRGFRAKYSSYGRFAGTVVLKNLTEEDRDDLEGFLRRNYHGKRSASVSAERFEQALAESRFAGIDGKTLLELYFREPAEGKREQQLRERQQWQELLERVRKAAEQMKQARNVRSAAEADQTEDAGGSEAFQWLEEIRRAAAEEAGPEGKKTEEGWLTYLKKRCREAGGGLAEAERLLILGVRILNALPAQNRYLAVFAAEMTGSPHAFDMGTKDGYYLELLVKWFVRTSGRVQSERRDGGNSAVFPALEKQRLYLEAGILRDDVSNYALAAGIRACGKDGLLHKGMAGFFSEGQPVQIPLSVIAGWTSVFCPGNRIYIVENPSVYAMLCGQWKRQCGLMCMNGQPRLSALLILDLLGKAGVSVWYAGDFDPEGLLIAQKLKQYYQGPFHYWHMSGKEYRSSLSSEEISPRRLKMLENITDPELTETAEEVRNEKKAGYQENIWAVYEDFLKAD